MASFADSPPFNSTTPSTLYQAGVHRGRYLDGWTVTLREEKYMFKHPLCLWRKQKGVYSTHGTKCLCHIMIRHQPSDQQFFFKMSLAFFLVVFYWILNLSNIARSQLTMNNNTTRRKRLALRHHMVRLWWRIAKETSSESANGTVNRNVTA